MLKFNKYLVIYLDLEFGNKTLIYGLNHVIIEAVTQKCHYCIKSQLKLEFCTIKFQFSHTVFTWTYVLDLTLFTGCTLFMSFKSK